VCVYVCARACVCVVIVTSTLQPSLSESVTGCCCSGIHFTQRNAYALPSKKMHNDNYPRTTYTPSINFSTTDGTHCPLLHVYHDTDINARECGGCQRAAPPGTTLPQRPQRRRAAARRRRRVCAGRRGQGATAGSEAPPRHTCSTVHDAHTHVDIIVQL
jgi:hypothetical protein